MGRDRRRSAVLQALVALLLSGCASVPASINPVSWWHDLQGGPIADERPPAPGAADPYPILGAKPRRPVTTDPATRTSIADALVADRTRAQHEAALTPLPDPSSRSASPDLFGRGAPPPGPPPLPADAPAATLATASAPAGPPGDVAPPAAKSGGAPVARPGGAPADGAALMPPPTGGSAASGTLPPIPTSPPSPPNLPGAPAATPVRTAQAPAAAVPVGKVEIGFAAGSAQVAPPSAEALRALAARRGSAAIAVTGNGDAASDSPDAQVSALALGLARAEAIAASLAAAGAPRSVIAIEAQAVGRGGAARLVDISR